MRAGDVITRDSGFMRGHGTFMSDEVLHASVAGVVERVNKLISVTPLKTRYRYLTYRPGQVILIS
jgi:exosome complex component RRP4